MTRIVCEPGKAGQPALMGFMDKAKEMLGKHDDKVDKGLDKAGETAKGRVEGHDDQIDQGVDRVKGMTGEGDTTQQAPPPNATEQAPLPPNATEQPPPPPPPPR